jgi:hypothetical protein
LGGSDFWAQFLRRSFSDAVFETQILGGAALQRCDKYIDVNAALAAEVTTLAC